MFAAQSVRLDVFGREFIFFLSFGSNKMPHRLAKVSEMNEEDDEKGPVEALLADRSRTPRHSGSLHVKISEGDDKSISDAYSLGDMRRPSILIQDILSTRRPSAIMSAIRSPKQFVNKYSRG